MPHNAVVWNSKDTTENHVEMFTRLYNDAESAQKRKEEMEKIHTTCRYSVAIVMFDEFGEPGHTV
jgi:pyridoxine 5'-phosphate synthase PdxJ